MVQLRGFSVGSADSVTEFQWNHTVPSGDDRALIFFVNVEGDQQLSQVTYNGSSCSLLGRFKESSSVFDMAGEAWFVALGSGAEITTGVLFASGGNGTIDLASFIISDVTGAHQGTTTGAVSGTQNLGTAQSSAYTEISTLYESSVVLVQCGARGGDVTPWTSIGSLTDTFDGNTGDSSLSDYSIYFGYKSANAGTYGVGADGSASDENVAMAVEVHTVTSGSVTTATPSQASATVSVFSPTLLITKSQTASPGQASAKVSVGQVTALSNVSSLATPSLGAVTVSVFTPTTEISGSATATPSLASVSVLVPEVSTSSGSGSKASPGKSSVSVSVGQVSAVVSKSASVVAGLASASFQVFTATAVTSATLSSTATPSGSAVTVSVLSATASVTDGTTSSTATPDLSAVTVKVYSVTTILDLEDIFLDSRIEKYINMNSKMGE